jgi:hypothetical protein
VLAPASAHAPVVRRHAPTPPPSPSERLCRPPLAAGNPSRSVVVDRSPRSKPVTALMRCKRRSSRPVGGSKSSQSSCGAGVGLHGKQHQLAIRACLVGGELSIAGVAVSARRRALKAAQCPGVRTLPGLYSGDDVCPSGSPLSPPGEGDRDEGADDLNRSGRLSRAPERSFTARRSR